MRDKVIITKNDGTQKEYDILFSFSKKGKNYITFTDYSHDEVGNIKCYSKEQKNNQLIDINDNDIDIVITDMLNTIEEDTREKYKKMSLID